MCCLWRSGTESRCSAQSQPECRRLGGTYGRGVSGTDRDHSCGKFRAAGVRRSPRPDTPNLRSRAEMWTDTVLGLINSASAMSRLDAPLATKLRISRSRGVSPSSTGWAVVSRPARRRTSATKAASGAAPSSWAADAEWRKRRLCFTPRTGCELRLRPPSLRVCLVIPVPERTPTVADRSPRLELRYLCLSARDPSELRVGLGDPGTDRAIVRTDGVGRRHQLPSVSASFTLLAAGSPPAGRQTTVCLKPYSDLRSPHRAAYSEMPREASDFRLAALPCGCRAMSF
jgi:hypothetical protein